MSHLKIDDRPPRTKVGPQPLLAWLVVLIIAAGTIAIQSVDVNGKSGDAEPTSSESAGLGDSEMVTVLGRPLLGLSSWTSIDSDLQKLIDNPQLVQQIRGWILIGTTQRDRAIKGLEQISAEQGRDSDLGAAAHLAATAMAGEPVDATELKSQLGWFGKLAMAVGGSGSELDAMRASAASMLIVLVIGIAAVGFAALIGLILGIIALTQIGSGRVRSSLSEADSIHGLYVETFALWLVCLNVMTMLAGVLASSLNVTGFTALVVCFPASLIALAWPSLRGSSFARTACDIGLSRGRGILREAGAGVIGWMGMLPIQGIGIVGTYVLMAIAGVSEGDAEAPSHPIIDALGDPLAAVSAFIVAVVMAPLVEEIAFRGLLYRQLRSWSALGRGSLSVLVSAVLTGLLFAAVHPQGWMAIPSLMSIAIALALAREWRGSLIAPMVMHGINNALAVAALLIIIKS
ncbi:MAG: CPBP family intramembrane metalloprotease [Phycisphaerales bacterium]|nr:CPBP family intramembrane metalloprotease [Phycisphaerales bacterium]